MLSWKLKQSPPIERLFCAPGNGGPEEIVGFRRERGRYNRQRSSFPRRDKTGKHGLVTAGGRVLSVTALGENIGDARTRAYEAVSRIYFEDCQYRRDIALTAVNR